MARISISGIGIEYELVGKAGDPAVALTAGGRFSKEAPGMPELAKALAAGGRRVLLWDRPNAGGASDMCFDADNESRLHARFLIGLIRALELGPTALLGGSVGSRISMMAASSDPEAVSHLVLWWITGTASTTGLFLLPNYQFLRPAVAAARGAMAEVAALPEWAEQIKRNPRNRDILMSQDPEKFIETMERWASCYFPSKDSPVPTISPVDFQRLRMPTLIFRGGKSDLSHSRRASEQVHAVIPQSRLVDPPWGDQEWNERFAAAQKEGKGPFGRWPLLAPAISEFLRS